MRCAANNILSNIFSIAHHVDDFEHYYFLLITDLSRNRLCELPEDLTGFPFLETLLMYHNSLRTIPESIRGLHSLSFLDLRYVPIQYGNGFIQFGS